MTRAAPPIVLNNQAAWLASAGEHRLDGFGDGYAVGERIDGGHRVELGAVTSKRLRDPAGKRMRAGRAGADTLHTKPVLLNQRLHGSGDCHEPGLDC